MGRKRHSVKRHNAGSPAASGNPKAAGEPNADKLDDQLPQKQRCGQIGGSVCFKECQVPSGSSTAPGVDDAELELDDGLVVAEAEPRLITFDADVPGIPARQKPCLDPLDLALAGGQEQKNYSRYFQASYRYQLFGTRGSGAQQLVDVLPWRCTELAAVLAAEL